MRGFEEESEAIISAARNQRLRVLIWGPGDPGDGGSDESKKGYQKRCEMRLALQERFPQSEVLFSEDILPRLEDPITDEALHAKAAHAIIILAISRGSHFELDHFVTTYSWFRDRAWVLVPQQYLGTQGIVESVFRLVPQHQIKGFTPEQFSKSDVAKKLSVNIVETVAIRILLGGA